MDDSFQAQILRGKAVYQGTCSVCHMQDGAGLPNVFPPLKNADYLMADKKRSIEVILKGLSGPITVNGKEYSGVMPPLTNLTDREVAAVLTYVRNDFGNKGDAVTPAEVAAVRATLPAKIDSGHP